MHLHQHPRGYDEQALLSIVTEILQSMAAHCDDGEWMIQRRLVSWQVSDDLTEQVAAFGFTQAFLILGKEITESVEAK